MSRVIIMLFISALLTLPTAHATLVNGDFSTNDLNGWQTEDFNINTSSVSSPSSSVAVVNEQAVLETQGFSSDIGGITLLQELTFSGIATMLSFDIGIEQIGNDLSGTGLGFPDFLQVFYIDNVDFSFDRSFVSIDIAGAFDPASFTSLILQDLGNGLFRYSTDINALAGRSGALFFDLVDDDDEFFSRATVDNVIVDTTPVNAVPTPSTWLFYIFGLIGLHAFRMRKGSREG